MTKDELKASRLATAWIGGANLFADASQPNGLEAQEIEQPGDDSSEAFATLAAPLSAPIQGRRAMLEMTFAFRHGDRAVSSSYVLLDAVSGAPLELPGSGVFLIVYPQGAEYRANRVAADEPTQIAWPLRSFCPLQDDGRAVLSFVASGAGASPSSSHPEPVIFSPLAAEGGMALFDEACPAASGRAVASAGGVNATRSP